MNLKDNIEKLYWDDKSAPEDIEGWLIEHHEDPEADRQLRALLDNTSPVDASKAEEAFATFISNTGLKPRQSVWRRVFNIGTKVAAVLCVPLLILAVFLYRHGQKPQTEWQQISTSYGESRNLRLSDGTSIRIGSCTKVIYPDRFTGDDRKIFLTGEAYFDVAKDPDRKFVISTGDYDVTVHGTRFNLRSFPESTEDELALIEGSVSMHFNDSGRMLDVAPGEMVRYNKISEDCSRKTFSVNYYDEAIRQDGLIFTDSRLGDIVTQLAKRFEQVIIIEDSTVADERYYASFINNESLDGILTVLNTRNHLKIVKEDNVIRIYKRK